MAKQLTFTYEDEEYTLEFTRRTILEMERKGFIANDLADKPMTVLPQLFEGAFLAHHKFLKKDTIKTIFENMTNKEDLILKLMEMYNEPLEALVAEPEKKKGNVDWTASW